jgi:hypothetical protein
MLWVGGMMALLPLKNPALIYFIFALGAMIGASLWRSIQHQLCLLKNGMVVWAEVERIEEFANSVYVPEVRYFFEDPTGKTHTKRVSLSDSAFEAAHQSLRLQIVFDPKNPEDQLPLDHCTAIEY